MIFEQKISEELFAQKYMLNGEVSPEVALFDMATEIASVEKPRLRNYWRDRFLEEISSRRFIPGGRILANARPYSKIKNYGNCYVIPIADSLPSIYKALAEDAAISGTGGGVGFNCSAMRPKDAPIAKGGTASGPLSFLEVFDTSAQTIRNGGNRRAAHIAVMDISHPDIEEFITYKQGDKNKRLQHFNISVGISQEFIDALEADADWNLEFEGKVYKTLKARELFNKIAEHAFIHNEPGLLMYPSIDYRNAGYYIKEIGKIRACNPCVTGDSLIHVKLEDTEMTMTMKNIVAAWESGALRKAEVLSYNEMKHSAEWKPLENAFKTKEDAEVIRITDTKTGKQIKCTPDHRILTQRGWVEARDLKAEDELVQG